MSKYLNKYLVKLHKILIKDNESYYDPLTNKEVKIGGLEKAINEINKKWPKGISAGRLKEENKKLYDRVILEGDEGKLQYARSGNKWSVLRNKYPSALAAVKDLYPDGIKTAELRKDNHSLYIKLQREGNLSKISYTYQAWTNREKTVK